MSYRAAGRNEPPLGMYQGSADRLVVTTYNFYPGLGSQPMQADFGAVSKLELEGTAASLFMIVGDPMPRGLKIFVLASIQQPYLTPEYEDDDDEPFRREYVLGVAYRSIREFEDQFLPGVHPASSHRTVEVMLYEARASNITNQELSRQLRDGNVFVTPNGYEFVLREVEMP